MGVQREGSCAQPNRVCLPLAACPAVRYASRGQEHPQAGCPGLWHWLYLMLGPRDMLLQPGVSLQ